MLNTTGSLIGAKISGFLDSATYVTGISGSCWALGVIYSGVSGSVDPFSAGQHLKNRIKLSYIDIATLEALTTPPTNEVDLFLLPGS
jgi:phospholipase A2